MKRIFISYSRRDKSAEVFIDYQKLIAGENFIGRLGGEIIRSDCLVLLVSPRSVVSPWVQAEVAWAFTNKKPIVPVLVEPASLTELFFLVNLEQVDFTRWPDVSAAVSKLALALGLPDDPMQTAPAPEILSQPVLEEEEPAPKTVAFAREDLSEMFFAASEIEDPEQAVFLLRQVVEIDPDFMRGQASAFMQRQMKRLKPQRLKLLLEKAEAARLQGEWANIDRYARTG